jgi:hypothetical protein
MGSIAISSVAAGSALGGLFCTACFLAVGVVLVLLLITYVCHQSCRMEEGRVSW